MQSVRQTMEEVKLKQKERFDRNKTPQPFRIGDLVALYTPSTKKGLSTKLLLPWTQPWEIVNVLSDQLVELKWVRGRKLQFPVYIDD
jgi:hypothetical protein